MFIVVGATSVTVSYVMKARSKPVPQDTYVSVVRQSLYFLRFNTNKTVGVVNFSFWCGLVMKSSLGQPFLVLALIIKISAESVTFWMSFEYFLLV